LSGVALPLLVSARKAGLMLRLDGDRLVMTGQGVKPPDDLLGELRAQRGELIAALKAEADGFLPDPPTTSPQPRPDTPFTPDAASRTDPANGGGAGSIYLSAEYRDALIRAGLMRPVSWADPALRPSPGCFCSCCNGRRWWCETVEPRGWRCRTCHPPSGIRLGEYEDVRT
jgi:hypothetical protein